MLVVTSNPLLTRSLFRLVMRSLNGFDYAWSTFSLSPSSSSSSCLSLDWIHFVLVFHSFHLHLRHPHLLVHLSLIVLFIFVYIFRRLSLIRLQLLFFFQLPSFLSSSFSSSSFSFSSSSSSHLDPWFHVFFLFFFVLSGTHLIRLLIIHPNLLYKTRRRFLSKQLLRDADDDKVRHTKKKRKLTGKRKFHLLKYQDSFWMQIIVFVSLFQPINLFEFFTKRQKQNQSDACQLVHVPNDHTFFELRTWIAFNWSRQL